CMREGMPGGVIAMRAARLQESREEEPISRRTFLATALMNTTSAVLATGLVAERAHHISTRNRVGNVVPLFDRRGEQHSNGERTETSETQEPEEEPHLVPDELVGMMPSGLERDYLGPVASRERLPRELPPIAFNENLDAMLSEKKEINQMGNKGRSHGEVFERLADSYARLWNQGEIRKTNLAGLESLITDESYKLLQELDGSYDAIVRTYFRPYFEQNNIQGEYLRKFEVSAASMLAYLVRHITPDVQLAYIATEIMPSPERGAALLSFLLENAGLEFIERIPALGDQLLSYGPFQLTPFVIGEDASVTQLLKVIRKEHLVPDDLASFSSIEEHLRAGFLFATHNLIALMQDAIKGGRYAELVTLCESASAGSSGGRSTVFLEYLSAAHHRPVVAREVMQTWIAQNMNKPPASRTKTLSGSFGTSAADTQVKTYADKAQQHFMHIKRYLHRNPSTS
ncbi:MAG: hypothetical protein Q8K68_06145, partial [Nitrospirota bacterium]|nr:hypothetical protein [Nitrospirota bacterium]